MTSTSTSGIERIARLTENEVGPTEENVKQKIVVPLLELLGHRRVDLEFEYRTRRGGKLDIFIRNVPADCRVIIDTKSYNENLSEFLEQVKEYTFDENALLAVLANGTEVRIYSPLRGVAFERSLLYSFRRDKLHVETNWNLLSGILSHKDLSDKSVIKRIEDREREIKEAMEKEDHLKQEYKLRMEGIDSDIEGREEEIERLKRDRDNLKIETEQQIRMNWIDIGLPYDDVSSSNLRIVGEPGLGQITDNGGPARAGKVTFMELVDGGLIKDGQVLYFFHTRLFKEEKAQVLAVANKLKYTLDGRAYSTSDLAKVLLIKHGFKHDEHGVRGPMYWKTEDGILLTQLQEQVRRKRGDRR